MTPTTFGPLIPCEGKRPAYVADDDQFDAQWADAGWSGSYLTPEYIGRWSLITAIKLPADHWAYEPISRGFEPWAGGAEAPEDWDGGEVLYRDGHGAGRTPIRWHHRNFESDIIGYKRLAKPASPAEGVWTKPEYAAADFAYRQALFTDANDQMSALALAIDAALTAAHSPPNTVTLERMSEEEARELWGDLADNPHSWPGDGFVACLRHLDLIAPPETPLDRWCRERGVTAETKAIIREAMEAVK